MFRNTYVHGIPAEGKQRKWCVKCVFVIPLLFWNEKLAINQQEEINWQIYVINCPSVQKLQSKEQCEMLEIYCLWFIAILVVVLWIYRMNRTWKVSEKSQREHFPSIRNCRTVSRGELLNATHINYAECEKKFFIEFL